MSSSIWVTLCTYFFRDWAQPCRIVATNNLSVNLMSLDHSVLQGWPHFLHHAYQPSDTAVSTHHVMAKHLSSFCDVSITALLRLYPNCMIPFDHAFIHSAYWVSVYSILITSFKAFWLSPFTVPRPYALAALWTDLQSHHFLSLQLRHSSCVAIHNNLE